MHKILLVGDIIDLKTKFQDEEVVFKDMIVEHVDYLEETVDARQIGGEKLLHFFVPEAEITKRVRRSSFRTAQDEPYMIDTVLLKEEGYKPSLYGISLNKDQPMKRMHLVADKLAIAGPGHDKCLEMMMLWIQVTAPRYFWQEADTFRLSTKNSQSTMHTIFNDNLDENNFEDEITKDELKKLNEALATKSLLKIKQKLPESFLQTRVWMFSYKTLANIAKQRWNHRLPHWRHMLTDIALQMGHPELVFHVAEGIECEKSILGPRRD